MQKSIHSCVGMPWTSSEAWLVLVLCLTPLSPSDNGSWQPLLSTCCRSSVFKKAGDYPVPVLPFSGWGNVGTRKTSHFSKVTLMTHIVSAEPRLSPGGLTTQYLRLFQKVLSLLLTHLHLCWAPACVPGLRLSTFFFFNCKPFFLPYNLMVFFSPNSFQILPTSLPTQLYVLFSLTHFQKQTKK